MDMEYARWDSRPHVLFADGAYHRVMYRIAFDSNKLKRKRLVAEGAEWIIENGGIVLLSCLFKPNYPPIEHTEERFNAWNPALEIRPHGCEDFLINPIVNTNAVNWSQRFCHRRGASNIFRSF